MRDRETNKRPGHVFISYVREDSEHVDRLQRILEAAGIRVWRDTANLWPGQDWKIEISRAINAGSLVFIACFSENSERRSMSYQFEELRLAVDIMRRRPPGETWLIPVRFTVCDLPSFDLGPGRTLESLQRVDLFDEESWNSGTSRIIATVRRGLGEATANSASPSNVQTDGTSSEVLPSSPSIQSIPGAAEASSAKENFEYDFFILYVPVDVDIARRIKFELELGKYHIWWDDRSPSFSQDPAETLNAIKKCKYLLIVLSNALVHSSYAQGVLSDGAIQVIEAAGVTVLPLLYETCPAPPAIEERVFADFTKSSREGIGQVFEILRSNSPHQVRPTLREAITRLAGKIRETAELYVATDLGGTKAYISMMTRTGDRLFDRKFATQSHEDSLGLLGFLVAKILESIQGVRETTGISLDEIKAKIVAFGVAFAGPTDGQSGVVRDASNFQIKDFPLADKLKEHLGKPVFVENDANLGVLGEAWKGVANKRNNVVGIIIGTGIGGGIIIDGQLYVGSNSAAGEIGHMVLDEDSPATCGCGQQGCFEVLASRRAIALELERRKRLHGQSDIRWEATNLGSAELADYVEAGDTDAVEVLREVSKIWGKAVFTLLNVLNPDMIFFGGGFVRQLGERLGDAFLDPVREEVAEKCMNSIYELRGEKIPIVLGDLDNPVLMGACLLAIKRSRGGRVRVDTRVDVTDIVIKDLNDREIQVLESIYNYHPRATRISGIPESDFHENRLRRLRNRGLIATSDGPSFRRSQHVEITDLGRVAIEHIIESRNP